MKIYDPGPEPERPPPPGHDETMPPLMSAMAFQILGQFYGACWVTGSRELGSGAKVEAEFSRVMAEHVPAGSKPLTWREFHKAFKGVASEAMKLLDRE